MEKYLEKNYGGWLNYNPGEVRRGTALSTVCRRPSRQRAESERGPVPLASSWSGARDFESRGTTGPRESTEWTGEKVQAGLALVDVT